jgi:hypothetical protein
MRNHPLDREKTLNFLFTVFSSFFPSRSTINTKESHEYDARIGASLPLDPAFYGRPLYFQQPVTP